MAHRPALLFLLLWSVCFLPFVAGAEPYRPHQTVRILSKYMDDNGLQAPRTAMWTAALKAHTDTGWRLEFSLDGSGSGAPFCITAFSPAKTGEVKIEYQAQGAKIRVFENIMVLPDSPAPCDVLPVTSNTPGKTYTQRKTAGGTTFVRSYRTVTADVDPETALKNGWISKGNYSKTPLILITILDANGRTAARQLWPRNGDWWLYEENGLRRSWRLNSDE